MTHRGPQGEHAPWFVAALGVLLGLTLAKFGNPVVLDHLVSWPALGWDWILAPWPAVLGYFLLGMVVVLALRLARKGWHDSRRLFWGVRWLPLAWFGWQVLAWIGSVDRGLSGRVLIHDVGVVTCYYLGLLALGRVDDLRGFWLGLLAGFTWVLLMGFDQHYGGLEATRRFVYALPDWQSLPADYLKRLASDRVFSTLFYANTLAGVVLLVLPPLTVACWQLWPERWRMFRAITTGLLAYGGAACLVWSGSKAGWLIAALVAFVAVLHARMSRRAKFTLAAGGLVLALIGFGIRYQEYFQRGATSAVARLDYWRVATALSVEHPALGTGPGTFGIEYRERKPADAEMSHVVHNDYLQQASDSGIPGALLFIGWLWAAGRAATRRRRESMLQGAVWLGLLGWGAHSFFEFGMFIPAVSWVAMVHLGWAQTVEHCGGQPFTGSLASGLDEGPGVERPQPEPARKPGTRSLRS